MWILGAVACAMAVPALAAGTASAKTIWLCRPGLSSNPCLNDETATVELGNGSSFIEQAKPASNPPIDCFYVYPTVSSQFTENATEVIEPEEEAIAEAQASRFSQVCNVYAPIYPQLTIPAITPPNKPTSAGSLKAYIGVLTAFKEYLLHFNNGRGFELIGHSQGSAMLEQLIKEQIDPNPALHKQLVGAEILGGNVIVPEGKTVGGVVPDRPCMPGRGPDGVRGGVLELPPRTAGRCALRPDRCRTPTGAVRESDRAIPGTARGPDARLLSDVQRVRRQIPRVARESRTSAESVDAVGGIPE
jgi:hypothetical protein